MLIIKKEDNQYDVSLVLKCNKCNVEFERNKRNTWRNFMIHISKVHGGFVKNYKCGPRCNFVTLRKEYHDKHKLSQQCKMNSKYKACPNCERRYKNKKTIK